MFIVDTRTLEHFAKKTRLDSTQCQCSHCSLCCFLFFALCTLQTSTYAAPL